jgi:hypothetical protein
MGEKVQLKGGICEVNFGYNIKKEVYANLSSDIPKLYDMMRFLNFWGYKCHC